jgi:sugar lactone lactonase YvrE
MATELERVVDCRSALGEGPVWHEGAFHWVDIDGELFNRWDPATGETQSWAIGQKIGCAVPSKDGRWVAGTHHGLAWLDLDSGAVEPICDPEADRHDNRFNDGKCDPAGRLWAGTMSMRGEGPVGALYSLGPELVCRRMVEGIGTSNGLAWSTDGGIFYYIDTPTRRVDAFDYDMESGDLGERRTVIAFAGANENPDGMSIDAEGRLWVALWGGWSVVCVDPARGEIIDRIAVPVERVTSCCFGGDDLRDLYITTARVGLTDEQRAEQRDAGSVFRARMDVPGTSCCPYVRSPGEAW